MKLKYTFQFTNKDYSKETEIISLLEKKNG